MVKSIDFKLVTKGSQMVPIREIIFNENNLWSLTSDEMQRECSCWNAKRRTAYIESLCNNAAPTSLTFVAKTLGEKRTILDGQHRLKAIMDFMNGEFSVYHIGSSVFSKCSRKPYPEWPQECQKEFLKLKLPCTVYSIKEGETLNDEEYKDQKGYLFENLNSSKPVTQAEIKNIRKRKPTQQFSNYLNKIITDGDVFYFKGDKSSSITAWQDIVFIGYSFIIGELEKGGFNKFSYTTGAKEMPLDKQKTYLLETLKPEEFTRRLNIMSKALATSSYSAGEVLSSYLQSPTQLANAVVCLLALLGEGDESVGRTIDSIYAKVNEEKAEYNQWVQAKMLKKVFVDYINTLHNLYKRARNKK